MIASLASSLVERPGPLFRLYLEAEDRAAGRLTELEWLQLLQELVYRVSLGHLRGDEGEITLAELSDTIVRAKLLAEREIARRPAPLMFPVQSSPPLTRGELE